MYRRLKDGGSGVSPMTGLREVKAVSDRGQGDPLCGPLATVGLKNLLLLLFRMR